jgi:hexosaminidase
MILLTSPLFLNDRIQAQTDALGLIPRPQTVVAGAGQFVFDARTLISVDANSHQVGESLRANIEPSTALPLEFTPRQGRNMIILRLDKNLARLGKEGYTLDVDADRIKIHAFDQAGLFYGTQTLLQLMPQQIYRKAYFETVRLAETPSPSYWAPRWTVPSIHIEDKPRFAWRGALLDVSRHFFPKNFLLKFVDAMAVHKLNVFHLHLTDDQGWRIQIKKYPKLTEIGAWHKPNRLTNDPTTVPNIPDGGFYTQEDLLEVVAYAKKRFITVVPEIEMPGHAMAAIAAYPQLGNTGRRFVVPGVNEDSPDVLNPNDKTVEFMINVLSEVMAIFPSTFIHIGGDEVSKDPWRKNPEAQTQIRSLGLKNEEELQSWFVGQMDKYLTARGRRLIGWDEILEGGLAPGATVMSWRGTDGGIAAAKAGHDVVMAPTSHTYLDYYQSRLTSNEPQAIGGFIPLSQVYSFDPIPSGLTQDEAKHILGTQAQLWSEYIPNERHAEYMAFPRLSALAEVGWTEPALKSYDRFKARLHVHLKRLDEMDVAYRPLDE